MMLDYTLLFFFVYFYCGVKSYIFKKEVVVVGWEGDITLMIK